MYTGKIKFHIKNDNNTISWGLTDSRQKTPYKKDKADQLATPEDIKNNNYRYPSKYFGYCEIDGKPTLLIENRDKLKNGKFGPRYFKPATIVYHETTNKWTHNDRATDTPFLGVVLYDNEDKFKRKKLSLRYGEMFHINEKGLFIVEKIPQNEKIIKGNRLGF